MSGWVRVARAAALLSAIFAAGCATSPRPATQFATAARVEFTDIQTIPLGVGQGVTLDGDFVYLYGDADTGLVREFQWRDAGLGSLAATGRELRLTRGGEDMISQPTGIAVDPAGVAFIGDSGAAEARIVLVDWQRAWVDGTLDNAVLHSVIDDRSAGGTRPAWAWQGSRRLLATADSRGAAGELRLYDPERLAAAERTSDWGVLVGRRACGPWVQGLAWWSVVDGLVLVQNRLEGAGWRLTILPEFSKRLAGDAALHDLARPSDQVKGAAIRPDGRAVFVSSAAENNVYLGFISGPAPAPAEAAPANNPSAAPTILEESPASGR